MVRITRFGWHDAGPVAGQLHDPGWWQEPDDEPSLEPQRPRRRGKLKRSSPIDRSPPSNPPSAAGDSESAA